MKRKFKILDTTLRDGSYVVNFQMDEETTRNISLELDNIGFDYIEVGHGLGLGATELSEYSGACSDQQLLKAASETILKNKWGMFFIPGIADFNHIDLAKDYGIDFIRIGANINDYGKAIKYVEYASKVGIEVHSNFMKTYAIEPRIAKNTAAMAVDSGAYVISIVDSAGCMLNDEVAKYVNTFRSISNKVLVGFHGHDNLGLSVSNSITALEEGADLIDTSVRGLGRSAGNTIAELFLSVLLRKGYEIDLDIRKILNLGEKSIDRLLKDYSKLSSLSIICGLTKFHSSFYPKIQKVAVEHDVNELDLIVKLCDQDIINAPDKLLQEIAKKLK